MTLKEIDLSATTNQGSNNLRVVPIYLCLIYDTLHVGKFEKHFYGLNFTGWQINPAGLPYDPPGTNGRAWKRVWLLEDADEMLLPYERAEQEERDEYDQAIKDHEGEDL